jgi:hypothetical protein
MAVFKKAALACVLGLSVSSAFAAAESSASISNLKFELTSLIPGTAASFELLNKMGNTALNLNVTDTGAGESDQFGKTRVGTFGFTKEFETELTNASGSASIDASALAVSGRAFGAGTSYSAGAATGSGYYGSNNLALSAYSILVIRADASAFASATNPTACQSYYCGSSDQGVASASMGLNYNYSAAGSQISYSFSDSVTANAVAVGAHTVQEFKGYELITDPDYGYSYYRPIYETINYPLQEQTVTNARSFMAVFVNTTSQTQYASLNLGVSISGNANTPFAVASAGGPVASVPEAGSVMLSMIGFGLVGGLVARRRRAA